MNTPLRPARLDWSQGVPCASDFGDLYFSGEDGLAEARHVFLAQNHLARRFAALEANAGFTIIETGFGTGLNWLATLELWQASHAAGWLHYVSVEKHPLRIADLIAAQTHWPEHHVYATALQKHYPALMPGFHRLVFPEWRSTLTLFFGDVTDFLPRLSATADAWFLDGFAPERNPGMWNEAVYQGMAALSHEGSSFATFTTAVHVHRGLEAAGFSVEKMTGHGGKREMLCGHFGGAGKSRPAKPWLQRPARPVHEKKACVIGAGIAGASTAAALALRGWKVCVLEAADAIAEGASGNPAAIVYPRLADGKEALDHFPQQAWLFMQQQLAHAEGAAAAAWQPCGLLQLLTGNLQRERDKIAEGHYPEELLQLLDANTASGKAGIAIAHEAVWYRDAGYLQPAAWCRQLLDHPAISLRTNAAVKNLAHRDGVWHALDDGGRSLDASPVVIVANSLAARQLEQTARLPLQAVSGQVSAVTPSPMSEKLGTVLCHDGYLTPLLPSGAHCLGATFHPGDEGTTVTAEDNEENRRQLSAVLPELADSLSETTTWKGRKSLRCQSTDYLPLLGPMAAYDGFRKDYAGLRDGKRLDYPCLQTLPGLYVNLAHGAKGFTQAALAAEILVAEIAGEPAPVSQRVLDALHPLRFWVKDIKRGKQ